MNLISHSINAIIIYIGLLSTFPAFAQDSRPTIIVSDIDDTLKIVNVPTKSEAAFLAFSTNTVFYGMNDLFQTIHESIPKAEFIYLSNAPETLMGSTHRAFLENENFPAGPYIPKPGFFTQNHKISSLRTIIENKNPGTLILIGDNGEQDPQVYHQIQTEYKDTDLKIIQFIRIAFPSQIIPSSEGKLNDENLFETQIGFVSPVDILVPLMGLQLISEEKGQALVSKIEPELIKQKQTQNLDEDLALLDNGQTIAYPYFIDCRDYIWKWDGSLATFPSIQLESLKNKFNALCGTNHHFSDEIGSN